MLRSSAGPASGLSGADIACSVAACGRREAGVDGVDLQALALGVRVFADLLTACERNGVGVDAVRATFLSRLEWGVGVVGLCRGDGATAAGERVRRLGGAGHGAADGLFRGIDVGVGRACCCCGRASDSRRSGVWGAKISACARGNVCGEVVGRVGCDVLQACNCRFLGLRVGGLLGGRTRDTCV